MLERLVHAGNIRTGFGLTSSAHYRSILRVTYAPIAGRVFKIKGVPEAEDELRLGAGTADSRIGVPVRCLNHLANVHWSTTSWRMCLERSTPEQHASTSNFHCNPHREMAIPWARQQQNSEEVTERP